MDNEFDPYARKERDYKPPVLIKWVYIAFGIAILLGFLHLPE